MAQGKKGKKGKGKKGKSAAPELKPGTLFTGSTLLADFAQEGQKGSKGKKKGKNGKSGNDKHSAKVGYGPWDKEVYVASSDGLYPGKMLMLEEEAVQVLEISTTCKKGTKLVVKRACMGTKPTAHPVHAPVLALPQMVSHRPGFSPAPIIVPTANTEGEEGEEEADLEVKGKEIRTEDSQCLTTPAPMMRITEWFAQNRLDLRSGFVLRGRNDFWQYRRQHPFDEGKREDENSDSTTQLEDTYSGVFKTYKPHASFKRLPGYRVNAQSGWTPVFPYSTATPDSTSTWCRAGKESFDLQVPLQDTVRVPLVKQKGDKSLMIQQEQMLMYAVKHGHFETVQQLLLEGMSANMLCKEAGSRHWPRMSMLMLASQEAHPVVAQLLIDNKADLLLKTDRDETALSLAKSAMVSTQRILEEKVKKHEEELAAAAREAAEAALAEEARILALGKLSKFGSMKSLDGSFVSKKSSSSATCEGLDKQQVDPVLDEKNRIDNYVKTIGVLRLGYIAMVRELQAKVTDASKNLLLENLLMLAIEEDWADLATAVLNTGTSPNHSFSIHQPGAHCLETRVLYGIQLAAMRGHASVMDVLINNRAMVHGVSDIDGNTPLMEVARTGTAECARLLINAGVDLEASSLQGTAAHVAVTHGNALVLKELVHAGARIGGKNADGQDCVLRSWILAHGSGSKGKSPATLSSAVSVLGVFRDLFGRLAKEGRGGACDPYCYVCLGRSATGPWWPSGVRSCKVSNSPNPQWNELLQLSPEGDSDVALSFVKIEVWDWDQVGDEVLIGTVIKDLSHVNSQPNSTVAGLFKITPPTPHSSPEHDSQPASPEGGSSPASRSKDVSAGRLSLKLQLLRTGSLCSLHVYLEFAEQLLVQERHGKTMSDCLKSAALAGWSDMIHTCVEVQGADPNSRLDGDRCRLPVMYAAATQQEKTVRALLDNKADPNLADAQGVSALMWACAGRVHFAANANFSADFEASLDRTERRLCQLRIEYAAADFVSDNMADIDPRIKWKGHESKEEHDRLLHETTINHRDVVFSRYQTVDTLLKHGADPSHRDQRGNDAACYLKPEMLLDTFFDLEWLWC